MAHHERSAEDFISVSDSVEVKVVQTPRGKMTLFIAQETPTRRVTTQLVQRLREIGASRELLDFAERGAAEDAHDLAHGVNPASA